MLFWLVVLGVYMGWVESVYPKKPPDDDDTPKILEFLLRPELIPVKEPDDTPLQADRYIRIRAMLTRITGL